MRHLTRDITLSALGPLHVHRPSGRGSVSGSMSTVAGIAAMRSCMTRSIQAMCIACSWARAVVAGKNPQLSNVRRTRSQKNCVIWPTVLKMAAVHPAKGTGNYWLCSPSRQVRHCARRPVEFAVKVATVIDFSKHLTDTLSTVNWFDGRWNGQACRPISCICHSSNRYTTRPHTLELALLDCGRSCRARPKV